MHKSLLTFHLLINPVSLAGHPGLTAWRAQCAWKQATCNTSAGEVTLAVETCVCLGLHLGATVLLTQQQAAQHRLPTLLLSQHPEVAYCTESSSVCAVPQHKYSSGCTQSTLLSSRKIFCRSKWPENVLGVLRRIGLLF